MKKEKHNVNINENNVSFQKSEIQENIERQDQDQEYELSDPEDRVQKGYSGVHLKDNFMSDTDFDNCKGQKSGKGQGLYKVEGNESVEIEVHRGQGQDEVKGHDLDISVVMPPDGNLSENEANEGPMGEKIVKIEPVEVSRGLRQGVFEVLENFKYDEKCSHCKTAVQSDTSTVSSESENESCVSERSPTLKCVYCSRRFSKRQNFKTHSCVVNREKVVAVLGVRRPLVAVEVLQTLTHLLAAILGTTRHPLAAILGTTPVVVGSTLVQTAGSFFAR